jgi:hypothetical protein
MSDSRFPRALPVERADVPDEQSAARTRGKVGELRKRRKVVFWGIWKLRAPYEPFVGQDGNIVLRSLSEKRNQPAGYFIEVSRVSNIICTAE